MVAVHKSIQHPLHCLFAAFWLQADPVSGKLVVLLRTRPYILKLEDGIAFKREIGDYMGISTDPDSLKGMDKDKREEFEAAVRQVGGCMVCG
jgi:hypothetical protein